MNSKNLFKMAILSLLVSCGGGVSETPDQLVTINLTETSLDNTVEMEAGTIKIKNLKITPLEYTDESILSERAMVVADEDGVMVVMDDDQNKIFMFNSQDGKFISAIDRKGRSGEEYLGINNLSADIKNRELAVNDLLGNKIVIYDFDGNYLRSHQSDSLISFDYIGGDRFLGYNANVDNGSSFTYNFCLYDRDFNMVKGLDLRTSKDVPLSYWNPIYANRDNVYIRDTIFSFAAGEFTPLVAINKGEYKLPSDISMRDKASYKYITSDEAKLVGDYLFYTSFRLDGMKNIGEIWNAKEGKLLLRSEMYPNGEDKVMLPYEHEGVTLNLWSGYVYVGKGGRIYDKLSMSEIEGLGIENSDNPVIISYEIE